MKFASIIFLLAQSNTAAVARSALRAKPELEPALHVTVVTADANRPAVDGTTEGEELAADNPLVSDSFESFPSWDGLAHKTRTRRE